MLELREMNFKNIKTKNDLQSYAKLQWLYFNKKYFKGKLIWGGVFAQKNTSATRLQRFGAYFPRDNYITLHPRLVNAGEKAFLQTLLHEMCHQAVHQIDKPVGKYDVHGPIWKKWMIKCGLPTNATSTNPTETLMTAQEKEIYLDKKQRIEKELKKAEKQDIKIRYPKENQPAKYYSPTDNTWYKGLIVCKHDMQGKRWAFIISDTSSSWKTVPPEWFYELDPDENKKYSSASWIKSADDLRKYYNDKQTKRRQNKKFDFLKRF